MLKSSQKPKGMTLSTLVNLLQNRACQHPNQIAYTFLENGQKPNTTLTYRQLDQKARAIAAYLQTQLSPGARVLLAYPQSLEAIAAFFGCLYAGVVAIPAPAPEASRLKRTLPRLEAIAADAEASLILTAASLFTQLKFQATSFVSKINGKPSLFLNYYLSEGEIAANTPQLTTIPWLATEKIPLHFAPYWQEPQINSDTLAYLQYTSGSTSSPKGVMLDHRNLLEHLAALQQANGYDSHSVTVTWMPYFHDYGLVEGILQPLFNGTPCYFMSPTAFLKQPRRWLQAISQYSATHGQAPNFTYSYCLQRITSAEREQLDLSSWQVAGNAAEPINPEVIEQFCQTFETCGFRRQTFAPAYGLAEATLLVTTSRKTETPVFCTVSTEALSQNRLAETSTGKIIASSGRPLENTQITIVRPETLTRCAPDEIGEIWVASAGVARGYWHRPDATEETFGAYLRAPNGMGNGEQGTGNRVEYLTDEKSGSSSTDIEGPFLRTGDLGFIKNGELFVTGRLKDLLIMRGENYYPQDIEWVVEKSHSALRPGCGAAFSVEIEGVEQLAIAFEVERAASKNLNVDEVECAIRNAVAEHYELPIYAISLLKRGSIFKTSSGKIQRQACRKAFLEGSWESLATLTLGMAAKTQEMNPLNEAEVQLTEIWQKVLGLSAIGRNDNFFELGGDSLKAAVVVAEIEKEFGYDIPLSSLVEAATIEKLAKLVAQRFWENISPRSLVPINPNGNKRPFFYVHGIGGSGYSPNLTQYLDSERPFYGLQAVGLDGEQAPYTSVADMVEHYIQEVQTVQPEGPYLLGGRCIGGNIALEMARRLKKQGQQVLLVAMVDSPNPWITKEGKILTWNYWRASRKTSLEAQFLSYGLNCHQVKNILNVREAIYQALLNHIPQLYSGRVVYFSAVENREQGLYMFDPMQPNGWHSFVADGMEIIEVPGRHGTYHQQPHVRVLGEKLNTCLERVDCETLAMY
ncbi:MAG: AMP-binding protein [Spirulinaceae cyanobacterium]